jgi:FAD:protein FMN transferase
MEYYKFRAMNCEVTFAAEGQGREIEQGFAVTRSDVEAYEQRFTRFKDTSELSQLNWFSGNWFVASNDLFDVIQDALSLYKQTNGLFNPSILPDLKRIGYNRSMDEIRIHGADPLPVDDKLKKTSTDFDLIQLDSARSSILLPPGMQIDLGGIAKGWIAERASRLLSNYASACAVNAGGDMFLLGYPEGQSYWEIGLEDPRDPVVNLSVICAQAGALATSSRAKRVWQQGNEKRHHLIDPRTGEPARSPWLSVTVMSPFGAKSEAFAKAFLIAGPQAANAISEKSPDITYLAVDENGELSSIPLNLEKEYVSQ